MLCAMASVCLNTLKKIYLDSQSNFADFCFLYIEFSQTENVPNVCIMVNLRLKELM